MSNEVINQIVNNETAQLSSSGSYPALLTEAELIRMLRIPEVSVAIDYHNVIKNLIRFRDLPRVRMGKKLLFPRRAIMKWIEQETIWK